jgi:hypothetical protein
VDMAIILAAGVITYLVMRLLNKAKRSDRAT